MNKVITILLLCGFFAACKKGSNYPSTPDLTYKSVNGNLIPNSAPLEITMGVKDAEGDISDSIYFHQDGQTDVPFTGKIVPEFPKQNNLDAQISLILKFRDVILSVGETPDTLTFAVYLKDLAGHISDTIHTPKVIYLKK